MDLLQQDICGVGHAADPADSAPSGDAIGLDGRAGRQLDDAQIAVASYTVAVYEPADTVEVRRIRTGPATDPETGNPVAEIKKSWHTASDLYEEAESLLAGSEAGWNVYVGANPRPRHGASKDESIELARCVFADFDGVEPAEAVLRWESYGLPTPTLVISSGHGTHVYLRLTAPTTNLVAWRELQKDVAHALGGDSKVSNPERVMRLPGTLNCKGEPVPCRIVSRDDARRADWAEVRAIVPPRPTPAPATVVSRPARAGNEGERVKRCRAYVATMPDAVSGNGGHDATFDVAHATQKFGLDRAEAWAVLSDYNRTRCVPPWSERELEHKLDDAGRIASANGTVGGKLGDRGGRTPPPRIHPASTPATPDPESETGVEGVGCAGVVKYTPFPVDALPDSLARLTREGEAAIGCPSCYIAGPLLAGCAAAIGNTRRLNVKKGWSEPPVLWLLLAGESGTMKSAGIKLGAGPMYDLERAADQENRAASKRYKVALREYRAKADHWHKGGGKGDAPAEPEEPKYKRHVLSNATMEAIVALLADNPRGLLLARDELSGHFDGFDAYRKGKGGDAAAWLEFHDAGPVTIDRKSDHQEPLRVPHAAVGVVGGIQPGALKAALGNKHVENGMLARFLPCLPPPTVSEWTEDEVSNEARDDVGRVYQRLAGLGFGGESDGEQIPVRCGWTPDGKAAWIRFYNDHAAEVRRLRGPLRSAWSKLHGQAARIALVIHLVRWAEGDEPEDARDVDKVDARSVEAAVRIVRWYGNEIRRCYAICGITEATLGDEGQAEGRKPDRADELAHLAGFIARQQGRQATVNQVCKGLNRYKGKPEKARADMDALVTANQARWEYPKPGPKGGTQTEHLVLLDGDDHPGTPERTPATPSGDSESGVPGVG